MLRDVTPAEWDPEAEAAREAAMEGINRVVGRISARLSEEEHQDQPDPGQVASLLEQQAHWARVSGGLHHASAQRIAEIRAECSRILSGAR